MTTSFQREKKTAFKLIINNNFPSMALLINIPKLALG